MAQSGRLPGPSCSTNCWAFFSSTSRPWGAGSFGTELGTVSLGTWEASGFRVSGLQSGAWGSWD